MSSPALISMQIYKGDCTTRAGWLFLFFRIKDKMDIWLHMQI